MRPDLRVGGGDAVEFVETADHETEAADAEVHIERLEEIDFLLADFQGLRIGVEFLFPHTEFPQCGEEAEPGGGGNFATLLGPG